MFKIFSFRTPVIYLAIAFCFVVTTSAEQLPLKHYTIQDGLPQNGINRIAQDSRGFTWFCTNGGLSRFDGYEFANFGAAQGLPGDRVMDFLETRRGEYWLATNGGLVKFNPDGLAYNRVFNESEAVALSRQERPMFITYQPSERVKMVTQLLEDSRGSIWVGTQDGFFRLETIEEKTRLQPVDVGLPPPEGNSNYAYSLYEDRSGAIWLGTERSLYRMTADNRVTSYTTNEPNAIYFRALFEDGRGNFWAGTSKKGLFQIRLDSAGVPQVAHAFTPENGSVLEWINDIAESFDGKLWLATSGGLVEFTPAENLADSTFELYTRRTGLGYSNYQCLYEDRAGDLWLGTRANGAFRLARRGLVAYGLEENISFIRSVFAARNNEIILVGFLTDPELATGGSRVTASKKPFKPHIWSLGRFDGKKFDWIVPALPPEVDYFGWGEQQLSFQSRTGEWWISTGEGLFRFPAVAFEELPKARPLAVYNDRNGLVPHDVFRLYEDSRGDVWISTSSIKGNGFFKWERATETLRNLNETAGLPSLKDNLINAFGEDRAGNFWIGYFDKGLARIRRDGKIDYFDKVENLLNAGVNGIFADNKGRLWLATYRGVVRVDEPDADSPRFATYTTAEGLSSNRTSAIIEDKQGFIYIGTDRDVNRLDPATGKIRYLRIGSNLPQREFRSAVADANGVLWFGTTDGLVKYAPPASETKSSPPEVLLTNVLIEGAPQRISALGATEIALGELAPEQNQVRIDFVSLAANGDDQMRYQHRIGAQTDWSKPDTTRSLDFANLAPGDYRIEIRGVNADDVPSAKPAVVTFRILPPFYLRWWFLLFSALILGATVYGIYHFRLTKLLEIERTRTRIATDLHDDIGASLSRIALLSEVVKQHDGLKNKESAERLGQIAENARSLVDSMSDIVWSIDPRRDDLISLVQRIRLFAADTLGERGVRWTLDVAPELYEIHLSPEQRRGLYLIFKEAITNIARHANCRSVSLKIALNRQNLIAEIEDDGCGLPDLSAEQLADNSRGGRGLENMHRRAAEIGGNLKINSSKNGTKLVLTLPRLQTKSIFMLFRLFGK